MRPTSSLLSLVLFICLQNYNIFTKRANKLQYFSPFCLLFSLMKILKLYCALRITTIRIYEYYCVILHLAFPMALHSIQFLNACFTTFQQEKRLESATIQIFSLTLLPVIMAFS